MHPEPQKDEGGFEGAAEDVQGQALTLQHVLWMGDEEGLGLEGGQLISKP